jgi:hypothetical protein
MEYWDARDARKALKGTKGKVVCASKVSLEFSLPGGAHRKNIELMQRNRPPVISRMPASPCTINFWEKPRFNTTVRSIKNQELIVVNTILRGCHFVRRVRS